MLLAIGVIVYAFFSSVKMTECPSISGKELFTSKYVCSLCNRFIFNFNCFHFGFECRFLNLRHFLHI